MRADEHHQQQLGQEQREAEYWSKINDLRKNLAAMEACDINLQEWLGLFELQIDKFRRLGNGRPFKCRTCNTPASAAVYCGQCMTCHCRDFPDLEWDGVNNMLDAKRTLLSHEEKETGIKELSMFGPPNGGSR